MSIKTDLSPSWRITMSIKTDLSPSMLLADVVDISLALSKY